MVLPIVGSLLQIGSDFGTRIPYLSERRQDLQECHGRLGPSVSFYSGMSHPRTVASCASTISEGPG
jgi:hypothetical protein